MKIVVVSGGKAPSKELLCEEIKNCSYIICADSGANCLYDYKINPHLLLGDFDSIDSKVLEYFKSTKCEVITYPKEKDFTDSEVAIDKAISLGADYIVLLGFTGSRIDHLLGNLGLLTKCLNFGIKASIKDDNNTVLIEDKPFSIRGKKGDILSLQAYCDVVEDLTIQRAKYPLNNCNLKLGDSLTISNEFLYNEVNITFKSGKLLVILARD